VDDYDYNELEEDGTERIGVVSLNTGTTSFNTTLNLTGHILLGLGIATSLLLCMFLQALNQESGKRKKVNSNVCMQLREYGTGRNGPSIQSGQTKLSHFLIYLRYTVLVDYTCTKFEVLGLHEAAQTDSGTKSVKNVLGGTFCILQCCWHCIYVCFSALERVYQLIFSVHMVKQCYLPYKKITTVCLL
jgi:hypothetical protein